MRILEVGPGQGALTQALLASDAVDVTVVEKDRRCIPVLEALGQAHPGRLHIREGDALKTDLASLAPPPRMIVSNLPYNIGTALLVLWLKQLAADAACYRSLVLMFQKEVAERIAAKPDTKAYGRLSVPAGWLCEVELLFDVPPGCFSPPPKVTSSVIRLTPRPQPLYPASWDALERLLAAAFGQRRKMLRSALRSLMPAPEMWLTNTGIDPTRRAETLSIEEFCLLANILPI